MSVTIVGIDCVTTNRNTGLAFASLPANGLPMVEECFVAQAAPSLAAGPFFPLIAPSFDPPISRD